MLKSPERHKWSMYFLPVVVELLFGEVRPFLQESNYLGCFWSGHDERQLYFECKIYLFSSLTQAIWCPI
jgi:hypothetical protein